MNLRLSPALCRRRLQSGSAVLIVLILLSLIGTLAISNAIELRRLKFELDHIEAKQRQRLALTTKVQ
jgi:hypothetical protein